MPKTKVLCSSILILLLLSELGSEFAQGSELAQSSAQGSDRKPAAVVRKKTAVPIYYVPYVPPVDKPMPSRLHRFSFGALVGFDMITSGLQEVGSPGFGAAVTYVMTPVWTVGISGQFLNSTPEDLSKSTGATSTLTLLLGTLDYHFPGLDNLYLGARVGAGLRNSIYSTPLSGNTTTTSIAFGGLAGWKFQIIDALSLSPQAGVVRVTTAEPTMDMFFQLAIQYWP